MSESEKSAQDPAIELQQDSWRIMLNRLLNRNCDLPTGTSQEYIVLVCEAWIRKQYGLPPDAPLTEPSYEVGDFSGGGDSGSFTFVFMEDLFAESEHECDSDFKDTHDKVNQWLHDQAMEALDIYGFDGPPYYGGEIHYWPKEQCLAIEGTAECSDKADWIPVEGTESEVVVILTEEEMAFIRENHTPESSLWNTQQHVDPGWMLGEFMPTEGDMQLDSAAEFVCLFDCNDGPLSESHLSVIRKISQGFKDLLAEVLPAMDVDQSPYCFDVELPLPGVETQAEFYLTVGSCQIVQEITDVSGRIYLSDSADNVPEEGEEAQAE